MKSMKLINIHPGIIVIKSDYILTKTSNMYVVAKVGLSLPLHPIIDADSIKRPISKAKKFTTEYPIFFLDDFLVGKGIYPTL